MALKTQNDWHNPVDIKQGQTLEQLFLGYHPDFGYMIMDWRTGHGWRDIHRNISITPQKVCFICRPKPDGDCEN